MSFRTMVNQNKAMDQEEILQLIQKENYGVLSVNGDDGFPYGVPVNYLYHDGKFIIHGTAGNSHKLDSIRKDDKVCLTIVGEHELIEEDYTTEFSSVIVFGTAKIVSSDEEKKELMTAFVKGLAPAAYDQIKDRCVKESRGYSMLVITPAYITGKHS